MTNFIYKNDLPTDLVFGTSVAIDTETMGLNIDRDRLCLIQLSFGDGNAHLVQLTDGNFNAPNLKKLLSDESILKLFHFGRFDIAMIYKHLGVLCKNVYCTKIASKIVRTNTDRHGLKELCRVLLEVDLNKEQQTSDWGSDNYSAEQINYAANDVLYLHRLREKLNILAVREGRADLVKGCCDFLPFRAKLDVAGFIDDVFAH